MTNFELTGLPRIGIGNFEFGVVHYEKLEDLEVYDHLGQVGICKLDGRFRTVEISLTADSVKNNTISCDRFLVSLYDFETIEELKEQCAYSFPDKDKLYRVIGKIDYDGYKEILEMKLGYYKHF